VRIVMNVDPDAIDASVPSLILQPLVENAVRHGLEPKADGGTVEVFARRRLDLLELEVRDDGCGLPRDDGAGAPGWREGVGLQNTAARLEHLYGDAYRFSVRPRVTGGTIVAIQIPFSPAVTLHVARGGSLPTEPMRQLETA
jgi:sensor histidine kinase YesM